MKKFIVLTLLLVAAGMVSAGTIITAVDRANGTSGDRDWIGPWDSETDPGVGILADGEYVFSDRTYPWANTPAELVGAEYVLMFNSDKDGGETDVTYTITTSMPAMVAITIDDRIPAEWDNGGAFTSTQDAVDAVVAAFAAAGTFQDTGLDLFVHENDTTDRQMSVYAAMLPAGEYTFGAQPSGKNFYTIGAVPEPMTLALLGLGSLALVRRRR
ncbi:MAG: PEP-CTERM sorting domain-containing protein [Sedimentisphaerales bacterium]|nr:PEP-CTERM sorting domain-containing protein [Sedimentisphaerales bacterium]